MNMKKKRIWKVLFFLFLACMTVLWQQRPARADNVYSGTAGDCIWYYNQYTHTLTVSGEGELSFDVYPDWHDYASDIQKIEIGDGVTDLHYYAFKDCNQVKSVRIPGSVEMIGSNAFENCTSLTEVVLEEGIQRIGMAAFRYTGLTSVAIPSSVVRIGDFAFEDCRNLTSVTFGKGTSLEKIGYESFYNTGLTEITIPASVTNIDEHAVGFKDNESNYTIPVPNFIIRGREGSAAQTYADQYFLTFENTLITYDLEVDGVPVTNENCDDILENGIFRYDPEKKFLYINGNYQAKTDILILNKIDRLQIQLEQDSKLDCVNGIISMESLDIFTSSHVLTINSSSNGISMRYAGNDILLNIIDSSLKVTGDKPIDSASPEYGTKLRIYQSTVQATITSAQYNWSAIGPFPDGIELVGCELILPYNSECSDGRIYGENHAWAKNVAIAPVQKYDLWIAGTQVNSVNYGNILGDGTFAYDPDHKVLKIKKSYTGEDATLISSEIQDLVIETAGDAEITLTTTDFDGHAMELQGNTTIRGTAGLVLQGYSMGILVMGNYTVTLDHIRLTINGKYGLIGEDFETASYGVGLYSDRLIIEGSSLLIKAAQEGYAIAGFESSSSGIVMKDCELVSPNNAYVQNGTVFIGKELVANTVEIEAVESYGIDIGDTTVTNHNCGDILGDGAFAYDPKTKTLTIKKSATVKGEVILTSMVNGLVIETVGQEDITLVQACDEPEGVMFMLGCDTTFRGTAKLILKGNAGIVMCETASLTFDHCNVSMEVGMCGIFTVELNEYGDVVSQLTIDSSSLSIDVLMGGTPYS